LGAKDFVKSFQDWLIDLVAEFDRDLGRRGRAPERIDRAAWQVVQLMSGRLTGTHSTRKQSRWRVMLKALAI